jgi:hypothetical protein
MIAAQARASDPLATAANGILGGIPKLIPASASADSVSVFGSRGLFGSLANLQPASPNTQAASYDPGPQQFLSPGLVGYHAGGPYIPAWGGGSLYADPNSNPPNQTDYAGPSSGRGWTGNAGDRAAAFMAGSDSGFGANPGSLLPGDQLAQAIILGLPPSFLLSEPPVKFGPTPEGLTPLEELPPGSAGGVNAGKRFPGPNPYPEGTPCTYCRQPTTNQPGRPNSLERDHNIPRGRGGASDKENRLPACRTCNRRKGARTPEEWYRWFFQRNDA